jgi:hypothetical protein
MYKKKANDLVNVIISRYTWLREKLETKMFLMLIWFCVLFVNQLIGYLTIPIK